MAEMAQSPGASSQGGIAQVRFGVYNQPGNHVGKTVGQVRETLGKLWGIPSDASAFLGKEKLNDDYVLQQNDSIEFHRRAGEKGIFSL